MPNVEINADVRLGLFWLNKEPVHLAVSLEVSPSVALPLHGVGPELGGYAQVRWVTTDGPGASVGLRAGAGVIALSDCIGFLEYPGVQLEVGHSWSWDGPALEMGGQLVMGLGSLEIAGTPPGAELHILRMQAGLHMPLFPLCIS